jgi:hypothetical protein
MRTKQALAIALSLLMAALPLWSSPDILGTVTNSQATSVRGANAVPGGSIFDGDTIVVGDTGAAWLSLLGGAQAQLGRNSRVRLTRTDSAVALEVSSGEVTFRSTPNAPLIGQVADGTFRPASKGPAVGLITMLEGNRALFLAREGDWTLTTARDSVTLHPGENMEARVVPETALAPDSSQSNPPPSNKNNNRKRLGLILLGAGAIGTATGIGLALGSGESTVTFQQKQNAISPVVP